MGEPAKRGLGIGSGMISGSGGSGSGDGFAFADSISLRMNQSIIGGIVVDVVGVVIAYPLAPMRSCVRR